MALFINANKSITFQSVKLHLFNEVCNQLNRTDDVKDASKVYFDNQIGIIEVTTTPPAPKKNREPKIAESAGGVCKVHQFSILAILEARNDQEKLKGDRNQFQSP